MRIPRLDHRIQISRIATGRNDYNEQSTEYVPFLNLFASRQDATAGEQWRASEIAAAVDAHFIVRYSIETREITPKDILTLENGKTYNIVGIRELERNQWLEIHAATRADK